VHWSEQVAGARPQPSHHHRHVAVPCVQWQPLPRRRAADRAAQLHPRRLHYLRSGRRQSDTGLRKEWRGWFFSISNRSSDVDYDIAARVSVVGRIAN